jgi:eukaryotic-like serine/threonine-protein kinase
MAVLESHVSENAVLAYVDGRASGRADVDQHLDACSECRLVVAGLAKTAAAAEMPSAPSLEPGRLFADRFTLIRELGSGAMGTVFEAMDETLGTIVALKIFTAELCEDPRMLRAIQREANLGRRLHHRNVRRIHDLGTSGPYFFLSMELIEGETLEDRLGRGALTTDEALSFLDQICDALTVAHAAGVVHRDLKPSNIIVESADRVVVVDFGLARDLHEDAHRSRALVGTPAYWSPEQGRGEPATPASDVYSLGLLAYELLTGESFSLQTKSALPSRYASVVARCLEQRPDARYPDAAAFRAALSRAKARPRWRPIGMVAAALGIVLGLSAAASLTMKGVSSASASTARHAPRAVASATEMPSVRVVGSPPAATVEPQAALPTVKVAPRSKRKSLAPVAAPAPAPAAPEPVVAPARRVIDRESPYETASR